MIMIWVALLTLGFPPLAMWARQTGGVRPLLLVTSCTVAGILAFSAALSSRAFGNRLVGQEGFWSVAPRTALLGLLTSGLQVVAIALVVQVLGSRGARSPVVYGVSILAALLALWAGVQIAMSLFWR